MQTRTGIKDNRQTTSYRKIRIGKERSRYNGNSAERKGAGIIPTHPPTVSEIRHSEPREFREKLGLVAEACNPSQDGIPVVIPTGGKLGLVDDSISDRLPNSQVYRTQGELKLQNEDPGSSASQK